MHWAIPKTKDRMLEPQTANEGTSGLNPGNSNANLRRASEGGAALYYGGRKNEVDGHNEVVNKFRNYEI